METTVNFLPGDSAYKDIHYCLPFITEANAEENLHHTLKEYVLGSLESGNIGNFFDLSCTNEVLIKFSDFFTDYYLQNLVLKFERCAPRIDVYKINITNTKFNLSLIDISFSRDVYAISTPLEEAVTTKESAMLLLPAVIVIFDFLLR